ncbi:MAG: translocation/assembly module TamB domain-containing protein [Thermoanaerobaculia bacterium]
MRLRRWVVRPFFWSLAAITLLLLCLRAFLSSDFARSEVRSRLEQQLSLILHRSVTIRRVDFELLPFTLRIEDLAISGPRPVDPPLVTVHRLSVEADLDSLRKNVIDLQTVTVQGVRVHLELYADGTDNLPRVKMGAGDGRFTLRIGSFSVREGELELADQRVPLSVDAHALLLQLSGLGGTELSGTVTAQEVVTTLPKAVPWGSTLTAKARLHDDRIEVVAAEVRAPGFSAHVTGDVGWRGGTHAELKTVVDASGKLVDDLGYLHGEIAGPLHFDGGVRFAGKKVHFDGQLTSPGVDVFGFHLDDLSGKVEGSPPRLSLAIERAQYAGGGITGNLSVDLDQPGPFARLAVVTEGAHLRRVLENLHLPAPAFAVGAVGNVDYEFRFDDARRGSGSATLLLQPAAADRPGEIAAEGKALLKLVDGRLELEEVTLDSPAQHITLHGAYDLIGRRGDLDVAVTTSDLGELGRLQPFVEAVPPPIWLPVAGAGAVHAQVALAPGTTDVDLDLELSNVRAPGGSAATARGSLTIGRDAVRDLDLQLARGGSTLTVRGLLPLASTGTAAGAPVLALDVDFTAWPVAEAKPWLPFALPLDGSATGKLRLGGSMEALSGDLQATVAPATLAGIAFDRVEADLDWNPTRVAVTSAKLSAAAGTLVGKGELISSGDRLNFDFRADRLDLEKQPLAALTAEHVAGALAARGTLTGTLAEPHLVVDSDLAGFGLVAAGSRRFTGNVHAELADRHLDLRLELPELLQIAGGGPFVPGENGDLAFVVTSDHVESLVALGVGRPFDGLGGTIRADLAVHLAPAEPPTATLTIPELELAYEAHRLRPLEPIVARLTPAGLVIDSFYLGEPASGDELFASGRIDFSSPGAPIDLRLQATTSVDWVEQFAGVDLSGQIDLLATVKGSVDRPEWNGQADLRDARYIPAHFPHSLDRLDGLVLLYPDALVLDHLRADLAGGTLAASGRIELATAAQPLSYRLQVATRGTSLRYPEGWLVRGDGDFTLQSTVEGRQITGSMNLDRVFYLQDINLSPRQLAERLLSRTRVQVDVADELLGTTYLNVSLQAPQAVRVRNNLAKITGSANLALRGTLANPVLFGDVTADAGGTIDYSGSTYTLDRAVLTFANPTRIDPLLDVVARTKINEYQVTLSILGSLGRPTTTLGSDPPLPDYDVLSLLATGSSTGLSDLSASAQPGTTPGLAAESLLYGQAASLVSQRVGKLFGIDRLRVDPLAGGDSPSAARVTIGKRLSSRIYLTYSADPSSTAQQVLQVEWKISDDLTLVLTQNGDESYAVDARWERRF